MKGTRVHRYAEKNSDDTLISISRFVRSPTYVQPLPLTAVSLSLHLILFFAPTFTETFCTLIPLFLLYPRFLPPSFSLSLCYPFFISQTRFSRRRIYPIQRYSSLDKQQTHFLQNTTIDTPTSALIFRVKNFPPCSKRMNLYYYHQQSFSVVVDCRFLLPI